jgi:hypothetical protein
MADENIKRMDRPLLADDGGLMPLDVAAPGRVGIVSSLIAAPAPPRDISPTAWRGSRRL